MTNSMSIGEYLIEQLEAHGVRHVFGVPGDYILKFFDQLCRSNLKTINSCDEQGAGFAADAYSRVNGLGVVCVTYGVGGLKVVNTTAQAYAEKSPVVVISGAPGVRERRNDPLLHHKVRGFDTQLRVFEQITVASAVLSDPATAFQWAITIGNSDARYPQLMSSIVLWAKKDPSAAAAAVQNADLPDDQRASLLDDIRQVAPRSN